MMSGTMKNTKQEIEFRKMLKQAYFDYRDSQKCQCHEDTYCHDLNLLEDVARQVFGWTDQRIEKYETRLYHEYRKENE